MLELSFSVLNPSQAQTGITKLISIGLLCLEVPRGCVSSMGWCKETWGVLNQI